jgi:hypothetical protein
LSDISSNYYATDRLTCCVWPLKNLFRAFITDISEARTGTEGTRSTRASPLQLLLFPLIDSQAYGMLGTTCLQ